MSKLKEKLNKQGGFTLIEMLIVVAIIAILIAIGIPMINRALESAREATDEANMRAALGIAMADFMMGDEDNTDDGDTFTPGDGVFTSDITSAQVAYYIIDNAAGSASASGSSKNGYLVLSTDTTNLPTGFDPDEGGYGKGTTLGADDHSHVGGYVQVTVQQDTGIVFAEWTVDVEP